MKISFDFDSTLSTLYIQEIAKAMVAAGHDVWVTTSRRPQDCTEVYAVTDVVGIPREKCQFTTFEDKVKFLDGFDVHFDDDDYEIDLINREREHGNFKCKGILLEFINWRADLVKMLPKD